MVKKRMSRNAMKVNKPKPTVVCLRKELIKVSDDWYPTKDGKVDLSLYRYEDDGRCVLSVWGGDDFGMELAGLDESRAQKLCDLIKGCGILTKKDFRDIGFRGV